MAEPTTTGGALLGASAVTMELLGVPLPPIVWGAIGSIIGARWAPAMSGWMALATYPAAALVSAVGGHWAAHHWLADDRVAANAGAALLAVVFHPLMAALVAGVPDLLAWGRAKLTGGGAK